MAGHLKVFLNCMLHIYMCYVYTFNKISKKYFGICIVTKYKIQMTKLCILKYKIMKIVGSSRASAKMS